MNSQAEDLPNINLRSSRGVCRSWEGPQEKAGTFTIREILLSQLGFEPRTIHHAASRYTD
jgi:hypothetical protein